MGKKINKSGSSGAATEPPKSNEVVLSVNDQATDQNSSALADSFALGASFFGKKASYVPEIQKENEKTIEEKDSIAGEKNKEEKKKTNELAKDTFESKVKEKHEGKEEVGSTDADTGAGEEKKTKKKKKKKKHLKGNDEELEEKESIPEDEKARRTVFVGNVSLDATQKDIKNHFSICGKVESVRLRYLPIAGCAVDQAGNQKLMMKVCANKKILATAKDNCNAYVTFVDESSVENALKLNKTTLVEKMIRVDRSEPIIDARRSVFIGNVPFKCTDEEMILFFTERLGTDEEPEPIENVRLIRDRESGIGKGFGYLLLKTPSLVAKTLTLRNLKMGSRELRVQVCGKRFKNSRGEKSVKKNFEGLRSSAGARARIQLKRKAGAKDGKRYLTANKGKHANITAQPVKKPKVKHASRNQAKTVDGKTQKKRKHDYSDYKNVDKPKAKKPKRANLKVTQ